ncbi:MAG: ImmA/IrrE family metallo-endopeptidase [Lutimaribacter sp.]
MTSTQATKAQSELAMVRQFTQTPGQPLVKLIRTLGLSYDEVEMPAGQSGEIRYENGHYKILINATESHARRRFTAAHELAHYLYHRDMLDDVGSLNRHSDWLFGTRENDARPFSPQHETEANRIAAQILMPAEQVRAEFEKANGDIELLADRFDVSEAAMKIRLKVLKLGD